MGGPGATLNLSSKRGATATFGIPGTGYSYQVPLHQDGLTRRPVTHIPATSHAQEVASAPVEEVAEIGMADLQDLIRGSYEERKLLTAELTRRKRAYDWRSTWVDYTAGPLFRFIFRKTTARMKAWVSRYKAAVEQVEEILENHGLTFDWSLSPAIVAQYDKVLKSFNAVTQSRAIWDIVGIQYIDGKRERTTAEASFNRLPVYFSASRPTYLPTLKGDDYPLVPKMQNANGADMYIFPGFLLVESPKNFAVISIADIKISYSDVSFQEDRAVPSDANITRYGWKYENKNGSRDMRFKDNKQIPWVKYGRLNLKSDGGVKEEYLFSASVLSKAFAGEFYRLALAVQKENELESLRAT